MDEDLQEQDFDNLGVGDFEEDEKGEEEEEEEEEDEQQRGSTIKTCVKPDASIAQEGEHVYGNYSVADSYGYDVQDDLGYGMESERVADPDPTSGFRYLGCFLNAAPHDFTAFSGKKSLEECRHEAVMQKYTKFGVSDGKCLPLAGYPFQGLVDDKSAQKSNQKCGAVDDAGYYHGTEGYLAMYATDACIWRQFN